MEEQDIVVTVKMLAYNHEKYIARAIESIVSQKTHYKFELLIGEDCSQDRTREIVRHYASLYPDIIRPLYYRENVGCSRNGYYLFQRARGKYLMWCEGDDYWCDDLRIQKDVEFLEKHLEYVGIAHKNCIVDEEGKLLSLDEIGERRGWWEYDREIYTLKDWEQWKMPAQVSAVTIRNHFRHPKYDYSIIYKASKYMGDKALWLTVTVEGNLYCDSEVVSCYRYRDTGAQKNYMTMYYETNLRADSFLMIRRLEHWARTVCGISVDLSGPKKDKLAASVTIFLRKPSWRNLSVIGRIVRYSGEPLKYLGYICKVIVWKLYCWHIKGTDERVNF